MLHSRGSSIYTSFAWFENLLLGRVDIGKVSIIADSWTHWITQWMRHFLHFPFLSKLVFLGCKKVHCNSGTCEPIAEDPWYLCYCPPGYSGVLCEYFDVCSTSPCGSHGQCQNITTDEYMCICDDNYIGSKCEYRNPCLEDSNPCENGGTCELIINDSFECICAEGFYGRKCKKRDPCVSDPCLNGGSCSRTFNDIFNCFCPPGFTGN